MKKLLLILFVSILFAETLSAQSFFNNRHNRRFMAIAGGGTSTYFGDLKGDNIFFDPTPNFSTGLEFGLNSQVTIRSEFLWYRLTGSDAVSQLPATVTRNLSFVANNTEVSTVVIYNLIRGGTRYYQRQIVTPYVFTGTGFTIHRPKAEYNGKTYGLRKYQTEGVKYSPVALVIPMGGGLKFMVSPSMNIIAEIGYRKTFTDYLDDVSSRYIDPSNFTDPIALALQDRAPEIGEEPRNPGGVRGNPDRNDAYAVYSIKMEYFIPAEILSVDKIRKRPPGTRPTKRAPNRKGFKLFGGR